MTKELLFNLYKETIDIYKEIEHEIKTITEEIWLPEYVKCYKELPAYCPGVTFDPKAEFINLIKKINHEKVEAIDILEKRKKIIWQNMNYLLISNADLFDDYYDLDEFKHYDYSVFQDAIYKLLDKFEDDEDY